MCVHACVFGRGNVCFYVISCQRNKSPKSHTVHILKKDLSGNMLHRYIYGFGISNVSVSDKESLFNGSKNDNIMNFCSEWNRVEVGTTQFLIDTQTHFLPINKMVNQGCQAIN